MIIIIIESGSCNNSLLISLLLLLFHLVDSPISINRLVSTFKLNLPGSDIHDVCMSDAVY